MPQNHRTTRTAAVMTLLACLAGCGGGGSARTATEPATVSRTQTPTGDRTLATTATPTASEGSTTGPFSVPTARATVEPTLVASPTATQVFTGAAANEFGAGQVAAAYQVATRLELASTFHGDAVQAAQLTVADTSFVDEYLDTNARQSLATEVVGAATSDTDAGNLYGLITYNENNHNGFVLRPPYTNDTAAGPATATVHKVAGQPDQLYLTFTVTGNLLYTKNGKNWKAPISKEVGMYLDHQTSGQNTWLVDAVSGKIAQIDAEPDAS